MLAAREAERLIRKYSDMIYRIALHNLNDPADADDIFQDVCIELLKKCPFGDDERIKAWLIRVTINKCRSFHRLFWQRNRESLEDHADMEAPAH